VVSFQDTHVENKFEFGISIQVIVEFQNGMKPRELQSRALHSTLLFERKQTAKRKVIVALKKFFRKSS
jgi:hypothetical protein